MILIGVHLLIHILSLYHDISFRSHKGFDLRQLDRDLPSHYCTIDQREDVRYHYPSFDLWPVQIARPVTTKNLTAPSPSAPLPPERTTRAILADPSSHNGLDWFVMGTWNIFWAKMKCDLWHFSAHGPLYHESNCKFLLEKFKSDE